MTAFPHIFEQRSIQSIVVQQFAHNLEGFGERGRLVVTRHFHPAALILIFVLMFLPLSGLAQGNGNEATIMLPGRAQLVLVKVPAGTFMMGSPAGERGNTFDNETQHQVTLTQDYYLGKTEVTNQQWKALMGTLPPFCEDGIGGNSLPVHCVTWDRIAGTGGFIEKLNQHLLTDVFRLPTEAEWERAARAGTTTRYSYGDALECGDECEFCTLHNVNMWWCGNPPQTCFEIDPNDPNICLRIGGTWPGAVGGGHLANPFGLHEMHGNVWEIVNDRYGDFSSASVTDPQGPGGSGDVVIRGGGREAHLNRSASRLNAAPDDRAQSNEIGFRIAASNLDGLAFEINAAISDAWFYPGTDGQGFFIIVWEDQKLVFLAWFTYDTERPPEDVLAILGEPGHRWVTALGPYNGDTAMLDVFLSSGMVFDSEEPPVTTETYDRATIEIVWSDCKKGLVKYFIPSLGLIGEIPIERIVEDKVAACEAAQP